MPPFMVPAPGGGGTFAGNHNDITGRSAADAHPMSAVTGLEDAIAGAGGGGVVPTAVRVATPVANLGGTVGSGSASIGAFSGLATGGVIWLTAQTSAADDGFYAHDGAGEFTATTDYLDGAYLGWVIAVGTDLEHSGATVYVVRNDGSGIVAVRVSTSEAELDATVTAAAAAATTAVSLAGSPFVTDDDEFEALRSTDLCLTLNGGAWSSGDPVQDTPNGLDIRAKIRLHRTAPGETNQTYQEVFTQQNPSNWGGDNFEAAILTPNLAFGANFTTNVPIMFWEHTPSKVLHPTCDGEVGYLADIGAYNPPTTRGDILTAEAALAHGQWATLRWVFDTTAGTVSFYREVMRGDDDQTTDGRNWRLIESWTWEFAESIDSGITTDWEIGLAASFDVAWLEVYHGPDGTQLVDIQPSHILTAGVDATSVTDGAANVWTAAGSSKVGYVSPLGARLAAIEAAP